MRTLFLLLTRRLSPAVFLLLFCMLGGADAAPVSFAKLAGLPSATGSASSPAATPAQTRASLDAVITLLDNDQQRTALVGELKQLRDGMAAQQTAQVQQAPGLLGAVASLIESGSLQADVDAGAPRYWLRRIDAAGDNASLLVAPGRRLRVLADFASTVGIWAAIAGGLLGLGWGLRRVFGLKAGLGPHPTTRALFIDALRKIGPWAVSFAVLMRLGHEATAGFVLALVLAYAIVWGAIATAAVAMLFSLFAGSAHRRVAVEYLLRRGMWSFFVAASLGACGDALVDPRVALVLGGALSLLLATVCNAASSLVLAVGALCLRRPIGQLIANRPFEQRSGQHAGNQFRRAIAVLWPVPVMVLAGATVLATLALPDNVDVVSRRAVMTSLLLVVAFLLSAVVRPRAHWRLHVRFGRTSPYLERLKHFFAALMQLAIWMAFLELVTRVWGHTLAEVLHSSVNGRRIADALAGLIGTVFSTWLAWILLDTAILQALSPAAGRARLQPSTRARTILPLLRNGLKVALVVTAGIGVLANLGVNVTPLVAGAGVIGLAVGFGAQSLAQDLITGIFILMEDTISVGDTVDVGVATGTVISLTIRTVRLRDGVGAIHSIPFSQIKTVRNLSRDYSFADFEVRVAMDADPRQAIDLVREAAARTAGDARFERILIGVPEVFGLDRFEGGAMIVKGRFKTRPQKQADVLRVFNVVLKDGFDTAGVPLAMPGTVLRASPALEQWMARAGAMPGDADPPPAQSPAAPA
ncbi:mechanosensitive ion channel family protein [Ralstonia solanacearum]|uniref:mechanosensitive ion channel family protein n=1 Tax=Ralstonia solanacearum TaxID=305 RepID=UPI00078CA603|nr:mechanosensitive ion channel family protein [Ralstonia solanacearum]AMP39033.1 mechanosensitive ion channel protein MscS [Ralstonia solanacearum]AXV87868.1 mechanosensitive ion channel family protein [Ralstonia solanacearum]AXW04631.1 mechanosensitive ion channel family protein [Ralstonia solanacearum]AXW22384.1 mechanosensitive ion channel family protein [Ralstonia solanacearum]AXW79342.1 mechanosensitive ion channel family protein [Ralstonia solanacearum]